MSSRGFLAGIGIAAVVAFSSLTLASAEAGSLADALHNIGHDVGCQCLGPDNEIIKFQRNMSHDLSQGPGEHNDLVGRKGWVRQRLGF